MSIRYWLYAIALGGCLTGYPLAYAQEAEPKPLGTVEKNEGAATQAPAPERDSGKDATAKNEADPTPIADDKPSEEEPCASRCQTAEQREKDDLAAQQSMAASTLEIADLTYWQAAIGAAGLGMLGLTLYLTQKSLAEARRATRAAEGSLETMREQTRAYLTPGEIVEFTFREQCPHVRLTMINTGSTGTRETRHLAWIYFSGGLSCPRDETIRAKQNDTPAYYFAATPYDQTWKFDFCSELIPKNVWNTTVRYTVHVSMHAIYRDVFGLLRHHHYVYSTSGKQVLTRPASPNKMRPAHGWDDACKDEKAEIQKTIEVLKALKSP